MRAQKYIGNLKRLQVLIQDEFSTARKALAKTNRTYPVNFDGIIGALQCEDILNQRIQHLIDGIECLTMFSPSKNLKNAILDLQYFQLLTIASDLKKTITLVRTLMDTSSTPLNATESATLFGRFTEIEELFKMSNRTSLGCVAQRIISGSNPLNPDQAAECIKLYTMQSERIVLQWFLASMPFGKEMDLLRFYEEQMNTGTGTLELF